MQDTSLLQQWEDPTSEEEAWVVSCPALPGCHSQGATRAEAIENIPIAIRGQGCPRSCPISTARRDRGASLPKISENSEELFPVFLSGMSER